MAYDHLPKVHLVTTGEMRRIAELVRTGQHTLTDATLNEIPWLRETKEWKYSFDLKDIRYDGDGPAGLQDWEFRLSTTDGSEFIEEEEAMDKLIAEVERMGSYMGGTLSLFILEESTDVDARSLCEFIEKELGFDCEYDLSKEDDSDYNVSHLEDDGEEDGED
jgi:hypothetical protein